MESGITRFDYKDVLQFVNDALRAAGIRDDVADLTAEGLIQASIRGVDSHGIRLLPHYLNAVEAGRINPDPHYRFKQTSPSTGTFDADHTFGHAAGIEAMREAIELAREAGTGHVAVYNSTHCGACAYFALEAAKKGFVGFSFTHANSLLNTPGSTRPFFGINPICMAVPCEGEEPFCFDSAPAAITWNKVIQLREDNLECPPFCGADEKGNETKNPHEITQLLPIGGYKGFGLSMMVEILCGLFTGMPVGRDISNMYEAPLSERRYLGQFYSAIRIEVFQDIDYFKRRMKKMMDDVRNEPRKDPGKPIMIPGDPEKIATADRLQHGIPIKEKDLRAFESIAKRYQIDFMKALSTF